jgi:uncharacterized damage-inducible protein DinB
MNLEDINQSYDYTQWANALVLEAAAKVPDEVLYRDAGASHTSIFGTLSHTAAADWIWLNRWRGRSPGKEEARSTWGLESCGNLPTLKDRWREVIDARNQFISELDEARLQVDLQFRLLNGDASSMRLVNQMQHVVNHATLHRGQVVVMLRQNGFEPPATDMLYYFRREIAPK